MVRRATDPLVGMGVALVAGAGLLVAETAGVAVPAVDPILAADALFVAGFLLGAAYQYRRGRGIGAAGHLVAVVGWLAGAAGRATGDPRPLAFSLAALGASGLVLLYLGVDDVRRSGDDPWPSVPDADERES